MLERVIELKLQPDQKFKLEVAEDIMHDILIQCDNSGTEYKKLDDGSYTFYTPGADHWSPKVWTDDRLPKGAFNIKLVDT